MGATSKEHGVKLAKKNLQQAWSSPLTKIGAAVGVLLVIGLAGAAVSVLRSGGTRAGEAQADGYGISGQEPRGAADAPTVQAVERRSDQMVEEARDAGVSFGGPFVFEGVSGPRSTGGGGGFEEKPMAGVKQTGPIFTALRDKAAEYDRAEQASQPRSGQGGYASGYSGQVSSGQGGVPGYGLSQEAFGQVTAQLKSVGSERPQYAWLANGVIMKPPTVSESKSASAAPAASGSPVGGQSAKQEAKEQVAARAGDVCPAKPEAAIDTDYNVPVFFEILECGPLTGARARGSIQKTPDDFTIVFNAFSLDPRRAQKLVAPVEGIAVSIERDGSPGVADSVNRHWVTRLGSSALMSLARTERSFIAARGSSTITTGTSSSVTIDPLSAEEKRTARAAGLLEGGMDVISKDLSTGINRQATMTLNKSTLVGIQFMSDVKVVPNEQ